MNANELLSRLTARGIRLRTVAGEIQVNRPGDILPDEREELRRLKPELVELIALRGREQPTDVLDPAERHRLMDETFDRLRAAYNAAGGWVIDWTTPNAINARIGKAFTRRELVPLLAEYTAVFLKGCPAP